MSSPFNTTTPGTILSFLQPSSPSPNIDDKWSLLPQLFTAHIPGIQSTVFYQAADPSYPKQHLLVSAVDNVARINATQVVRFWGDEKGVEGQADVRVFSGVELFEKERGRRQREMSMLFTSFC